MSKEQEWLYVRCRACDNKQLVGLSTNIHVIRGNDYTKEGDLIETLCNHCEVNLKSRVFSYKGELSNM